MLYNKRIKPCHRNFGFILFFFFSLQFFNPQSFAQTITSNFVHILSESGLSQSTIHSIFQDKYGFIWFATEDGLNKYDGYRFTVFKHNSQDKNSISDNFIWTIFSDRQGNMWIGTNIGGICKFDESKQEFKNYINDPLDSNSLVMNNVRAICEDKMGNIWIGTEGGLDKFNPKENKFTHYKHDPKVKNSLSDNVIISLYEDSSGELWIGSDGGLDRYDSQNDNFQNYSHVHGNPNSISNNIVLYITEDSNGELWIGTVNGVNRLDKKRVNFTSYLMNTSEDKISSENRINYILKDMTGTIWIASGDGFYKSQVKNSKMEFVKAEILVHNNVLSMMEDVSGLIWIGTAEDGIIKYDRKRIKFRHFKHDPFDPKSLSHNTVRAIYQEKDGTLWVGTLGGGLNKFNPTSNNFIIYKNDPDNKFSLSNNSISAIFKDSFGYLWIGTWNGGLNRSKNPLISNRDNISFINYRHSEDNKSIGGDIIQRIYEDSDKNLWIGTDEGLALYNRKSDNFIKFRNFESDSLSISSNQVQSCIIEDKFGNLWVGTWTGLSKLPNSLRKNAIANPSSVRFINYTNNENYKSLSDNRIISVYEDNDGNLWFGTYGGGINELKFDQLNSAQPEFKNFNSLHGLSSDIVYGIEGDNNNHLWLSTDNGLSMFNTKSGKIQNYDVEDGLQGNQFYWGASFKGINGELFFGGTNGFNSFFPSDLKINTHVPQVVLTDFQIFNKTVEINGKDSPLQTNISMTKEIKLSYKQNVFSFEFAALDYTAPNKNLYAYMMEGFDKGWIYSGKRRFVTYTNLDPGNYTFRIKGSNNDGVWNEEGNFIAITIMPPIWKTWWFILAGILIVGGLLAAIVFYRVKNLIAIERIRAKIAADLHDNIGSSLTEISILSEVISKKLKSTESDVRKNLQKISESSRNLIDNMSDIVWLVNPKRDSLYDLILRLRDTYSELSSYTSISFKSENIKELEKVSLSIEHRQHLYLIFKEAINNSITHSGCTQISLDAFVKGKKLEMILKDNGHGFSADMENKGNGLTNMKNRAEAIGGQLNITSVKGDGTIIQFIGSIL